MKYKVFSTKTGNVIATVPFAWMAMWICRRLDRTVFPLAYDYELIRSS